MLTLVKFIGWFIEQSVKGKLPEKKPKKITPYDVIYVNKKNGKRFKIKK